MEALVTSLEESEKAKTNKDLVKERLRVERGFLIIPDAPGIGVELIDNVRENKAFYTWVAEPQVESKGATLRFHETGTFLPLDAAAVSDIIDRVKAWYGVLPNQLMPA